MTTRQSPGVESGALESVAGAPTTIADAGTADAATRARCRVCMHLLDAPRSVARGFGPVCWKRTALGQLDTRRDAVGRSLAALARRVGRLDVEGLAGLEGALADLNTGVRADVR